MARNGKWKRKWKQKENTNKYASFIYCTICFVLFLKKCVHIKWASQKQLQLHFLISHSDFHQQISFPCGTFIIFQVIAKILSTNFWNGIRSTVCHINCRLCAPAVLLPLQLFRFISSSLSTFSQLFYIENVDFATLWLIIWDQHVFLDIFIWNVRSTVCINSRASMSFVDLQNYSLAGNDYLYEYQ